MTHRPAPRPRSYYRHFHRIGTRWHDNDAYGHLNNVVYYGLFDTAVNAMLVERGLLDIEASTTIGLVVETGCRYFSSLAFPDEIDVGLAVAKLGNASVTYHLGVFKVGAAQPSAEGFFVHVYVERASGKPTAMPAETRAVLGALLHKASEAGVPESQ